MTPHEVTQPLDYPAEPAPYEQPEYDPPCPPGMAALGLLLAAFVMWIAWALT